MRGITAVDRYFRHLPNLLHQPAKELELMTLEVGYGPTRIAIVSYMDHNQRVMVPYGTTLEYPAQSRKLYYKMPGGLRATNLRHPVYRRGESIRHSDVLEYSYEGQPVLRINLSEVVPFQQLRIKELPAPRLCFTRDAL
jgi:hypothetical protein